MADYNDDDDAIGSYLKGGYSPLDDPDAPPTLQVAQNNPPADPRQPGTPSYGGPALQRRPYVSPDSSQQAPAPAAQAAMPATPPPTGAVPAATTQSGNPISVSPRDAFKASLARQQAAVQGAEAQTSALQNQPDESTALAPIEKQRTTDATPLDPMAQQYRPGIGTRIFRGVTGGLMGLARGGVVGAALGAIDPKATTGVAYGDPNKKYDRDTDTQGKKVASDDQQITQARQAFKDASDRAKALAQEGRANATGENDIQKNINTSTKNDDAYHAALAKAGQKEVPGEDGNPKIVDDPDSSAYKARQSLEEYRQTLAKVDQLKADIAKDKITPGTPAWNQKQQEISNAGLRGKAQWGNYLMHSQGVGMDGQGLPGQTQVTNDAGQQTGVGTAFQTPAAKQQARVAQFNDVLGATDNIEKTAAALDKKSGKLNDPRVAAAIADPHSTSAQWAQGAFVNSGLNKEERDYVTSVKAYKENLQVLRASGTSDAQVNRLEAMAPGANTPDLNFLKTQTGQIRQTAGRLAEGITGIKGGHSVRTDASAAGSGSAAPAAQPPKALIDGMKEGQYIHGPGGSYQKKDGKLVPVK